MRSIILFVLAILLPACTTSTGALPYTVSQSVTPAAAGPVIARVEALDQRGQPPKRIGAIRGGFGNPLKTIETAEPVQDVVAVAFQKALRARGLLAAPAAGSYELVVTIRKLDCSQYVRREAHADFQIVVTDIARRPIYQDDVHVEIVSGSQFAFDVGIFGSTDELRAVAVEAMTKAIDQALDKPGFAAALADRPTASLLMRYNNIIEPTVNTP